MDCPDCDSRHAGVAKEGPCPRVTELSELQQQAVMQLVLGGYSIGDAVRRAIARSERR